MAHELDNSNGKIGFASRKQAAWHGLGQIVEAMNCEQALNLGGLNFEVVKSPNIHRINPEIEIVSTESFFTYRTDTNAVLGASLGKGYTVLQNKEALNLIDSVVESGKIQIETVGSLFGGARVFITCKAAESYKIGGNDEVEQYLVISKSHDGSKAVEVYFTDIRVVCNNTLQMSMKNATQMHRVKHTANVKSRTNEALRILNILDANLEAKEVAFTKLKETRFSEAKFFDYIGNLFYTKDEITELQKGNKEIISTRKKNIIKDVLDFANYGVGQAEAEEGSAWWAYNAITGYYSNQKVYNDAESRMQNLLWTSDAAVMDNALQLALEPGKIKSCAQKVITNFILN